MLADFCAQRDLSQPWPGSQSLEMNGEGGITDTASWDPPASLQPPPCIPDVSSSF